MDHAQLEEAVAAYAIGSLDEAERPEVEKALLDHLPGCASCREMLTDFREVVGDLALVASPSAVPEGVEERILEGIREHRQRIAPRVVARRSPWGRVAVAAVAAAVVALGAWNLQLASRVRGADTRTDRDSRLVLLVTLGVTEIRNDHRDRVRARTRERVDPEQQLHEVRIGWKDRRLHQVDASAANVLEHAHEQRSLREADNLARANPDV